MTHCPICGSRLKYWVHMRDWKHPIHVNCSSGMCRANGIIAHGSTVPEASEDFAKRCAEPAEEAKQ